MSSTNLYEAPGPRAKMRSRVITVITIVIVVAVLAFAFIRLGENGQLSADNWIILNDPLIWQRMIRSLGTLLLVGLIASIGAIALGMVFALLRAVQTPLVRWPTTVVLEFFRGMPVLLMMLFIFLLFPGSGMDFWAAVLALAFYNGAIIGEALRAGVASLPKGQREAGLSIGLTPLQTWLTIEFPQALRNMAPIIVAQLVVLLKDTSLATIVGLTVLTRESELIIEALGRPRSALPIFVLEVSMFLAINLTLSWIARRMARGRSAGAPRKRRTIVPPAGPVTPVEGAPTTSVIKSVS